MALDFNFGFSDEDLANSTQADDISNVASNFEGFATEQAADTDSLINTPYADEIAQQGYKDALENNFNSDDIGDFAFDNKNENYSDLFNNRGVTADGVDDLTLNKSSKFAKALVEIGGMDLAKAEREKLKKEKDEGWLSLTSWGRLVKHTVWSGWHTDDIPIIGVGFVSKDLYDIYDVRNKIVRGEPLTSTDKMWLKKYARQMEEQTAMTSWENSGEGLNDVLSFGADIFLSSVATFFSGGIFASGEATELTGKLAAKAGVRVVKKSLLESLGSTIKNVGTLGLLRGAESRGTVRALEELVEKKSASGVMSLLTRADEFSNIARIGSKEGAEGLAGKIARGAGEEAIDASAKLSELITKKGAKEGAENASKKLSALIAERGATEGVEKSVKPAFEISLNHYELGQIAFSNMKTRLVQKYVSKGLNKEVAKFAVDLVGNSTLGAITSLFNFGRAIEGDAQRKLNYSMSHDDIPNSFMWDALVDNASEYASEMSGGALTKIFTGPGKILFRRLGIINAMNKFTSYGKQMFARRALVGTLQRYRKLPYSYAGSSAMRDLREMYKKVGWDGTFGEMLEERYGDMLRAIFGSKNIDLTNATFAQAFAPGIEQIKNEAFLFAIPGAFTHLSSSATTHFFNRSNNIDMGERVTNGMIQLQVKSGEKDAQDFPKYRDALNLDSLQEHRENKDPEKTGLYKPSEESEASVSISGLSEEEGGAIEGDVPALNAQEDEVDFENLEEDDIKNETSLNDKGGDAKETANTVEASAEDDTDVDSELPPSVVEQEKKKKIPRIDSPLADLTGRRITKKEADILLQDFEMSDKEKKNLSKTEQVELAFYKSLVSSYGSSKHRLGKAFYDNAAKFRLNRFYAQIKTAFGNQFSDDEYKAIINRIASGMPGTNAYSSLSKPYSTEEAFVDLFKKSDYYNKTNLSELFKKFNSKFNTSESDVFRYLMAPSGEHRKAVLMEMALRNALSLERYTRNSDVDKVRALKSENYANKTAQQKYFDEIKNEFHNALGDFIVSINNFAFDNDPLSDYVFIPVEDHMFDKISQRKFYEFSTLTGESFANFNKALKSNVSSSLANSYIHSMDIVTKALRPYFESQEELDRVIFKLTVMNPFGDSYLPAEKLALLTLQSYFPKVFDALKVSEDFMDADKIVYGNQELRDALFHLGNSFLGLSREQSINDRILAQTVPEDIDNVFEELIDEFAQKGVNIIRDKSAGADRNSVIFTRGGEIFLNIDKAYNDYKFNGAKSVLGASTFGNYDKDTLSFKLGSVGGFTTYLSLLAKAEALRNKDFELNWDEAMNNAVVASVMNPEGISNPNKYIKNNIAKIARRLYNIVQPADRAEFNSAFGIDVTPKDEAAASFSKQFASAEQQEDDYLDGEESGIDGGGVCLFNVSKEMKASTASLFENIRKNEKIKEHIRIEPQHYIHTMLMPHLQKTRVPHFVPFDEPELAEQSGVEHFNLVSKWLHDALGEDNLELLGVITNSYLENNTYTVTDNNDEKHIKYDYESAANELTRFISFYSASPITHASLSNGNIKYLYSENGGSYALAKLREEIRMDDASSNSTDLGNRVKDSFNKALASYNDILGTQLLREFFKENIGVRFKDVDSNDTDKKDKINNTIDVFARSLYQSMHAYLAKHNKLGANAANIVKLFIKLNPTDFEFDENMVPKYSSEFGEYRAILTKFNELDKMKKFQLKNKSLKYIEEELSENENIRQFFKLAFDVDKFEAVGEFFNNLGVKDKDYNSIVDFDTNFYKKMTDIDSLLDLMASSVNHKRVVNQFKVYSNDFSYGVGKKAKKGTSFLGNFNYSRLNSMNGFDLLPEKMVFVVDYQFGKDYKSKKIDSDIENVKDTTSVVRDMMLKGYVWLGQFSDRGDLVFYDARDDFKNIKEFIESKHTIEDFDKLDSKERIDYLLEYYSDFIDDLLVDEDANKFAKESLLPPTERAIFTNEANNSVETENDSLESRDLKGLQVSSKSHKISDYMQMCKSGDKFLMSKSDYLLNHIVRTMAKFVTDGEDLLAYENQPYRVNKRAFQKTTPGYSPVTDFKDARINYVIIDSKEKIGNKTFYEEFGFNDGVEYILPDVLKNIHVSLGVDHRFSPDSSKFFVSGIDDFFLDKNRYLLKGHIVALTDEVIAMNPRLAQLRLFMENNNIGLTSFFDSAKADPLLYKNGTLLNFGDILNNPDGNYNIIPRSFKSSDVIYTTNLVKPPVFDDDKKIGLQILKNLAYFDSGQKILQERDTKIGRELQESFEKGEHYLHFIKRLLSSNDFNLLDTFFRKNFDKYFVLTRTPKGEIEDIAFKTIENDIEATDLLIREAKAFSENLISNNKELYNEAYKTFVNERLEARGLVKGLSFTSVPEVFGSEVYVSQRNNFEGSYRGKQIIKRIIKDKISKDFVKKHKYKPGGVRRAIQRYFVTPFLNKFVDEIQFTKEYKLKDYVKGNAYAEVDMNLDLTAKNNESVRAAEYVLFKSIEEVEAFIKKYKENYEDLFDKDGNFYKGVIEEVDESLYYDSSISKTRKGNKKVFKIAGSFLHISRVPADSLHSNVSVRVRHIVHSTTTNHMVIPARLAQIAGEDFDGDQRHVFIGKLIDEISPWFYTKKGFEIASREIDPNFFERFVDVNGNEHSIVNNAFEIDNNEKDDFIYNSIIQEIEMRSKALVGKKVLAMFSLLTSNYHASYYYDNALVGKIEHFIPFREIDPDDYFGTALGNLLGLSADNVKENKLGYYGITIDNVNLYVAYAYKKFKAIIEAIESKKGSLSDYEEFKQKKLAMGMDEEIIRLIYSDIHNFDIAHIEKMSTPSYFHEILLYAFNSANRLMSEYEFAKKQVAFLKKNGKKDFKLSKFLNIVNSVEQDSEVVEFLKRLNTVGARFKNQNLDFDKKINVEKYSASENEYITDNDWFNLLLDNYSYEKDSHSIRKIIKDGLFVDPELTGRDKSLAFFRAEKFAHALGFALTRDTSIVYYHQKSQYNGNYENEFLNYLYLNTDKLIFELRNEDVYKGQDYIDKDLLKRIHQSFYQLPEYIQDAIIRISILKNNGKINFSKQSKSILNIVPTEAIMKFNDDVLTGQKSLIGVSVDRESPEGSTFNEQTISYIPPSDVAVKNALNHYVPAKVDEEQGIDKVFVFPSPQMNIALGWVGKAKNSVKVAKVFMVKNPKSKNGGELVKGTKNIYKFKVYLDGVSPNQKEMKAIKNFKKRFPKARIFNEINQNTVENKNSNYKQMFSTYSYSDIVVGQNVIASDRANSYLITHISNFITLFKKMNAEAELATLEREPSSNDSINRIVDVKDVLNSILTEHTEQVDTEIENSTITSKESDDNIARADENGDETTLNESFNNTQELRTALDNINNGEATVDKDPDSATGFVGKLNSIGSMPKAENTPLTLNYVQHLVNRAKGRDIIDMKDDFNIQEKLKDDGTGFATAFEMLKEEVKHMNYNLKPNEKIILESNDKFFSIVMQDWFGNLDASTQMANVQGLELQKQFNSLFPHLSMEKKKFYDQALFFACNSEKVFGLPKTDIGFDMFVENQNKLEKALDKYRNMSNDELIETFFTNDMNWYLFPKEIRDRLTEIFADLKEEKFKKYMNLYSNGKNFTYDDFLEAKNDLDKLKEEIKIEKNEKKVKNFNIDSEYETEEKPGQDPNVKIKRKLNNFDREEPVKLNEENAVYVGFKNYDEYRKSKHAKDNPETLKSINLAGAMLGFNGFEHYAFEYGISDEDLVNMRKMYDTYNNAFDALYAKFKSLGVSFGHLDFYAPNIWDTSYYTKDDLEKFANSTSQNKYTKNRTFPDAMSGFIKKPKLKLVNSTLTESYDKYIRRMFLFVHNKTFLFMGMNCYDLNGNPFISDVPISGYEKMDKGIFRELIPIDKSKVPKNYSKKRYTTVQGPNNTLTYYKNQDYYINKKFKNAVDFAVTDSVEIHTKYRWMNKALIELFHFVKASKMIMIALGGFHYNALTRSYVLGAPWRWYKPSTWLYPAKVSGLAALKRSLEIEDLSTNIREMVKLGDVTDEVILRFLMSHGYDSFSGIGMLANKYSSNSFLMDGIATLPGASLAINTSRRFNNYLFANYGAGLKAKAAILEFREAIKQNKPENLQDYEKIARDVAEVVNDDFGGLNLKRKPKMFGLIERTPAKQFWYELLILAPDWTESNFGLIHNAIAGNPGARRKAFHLLARVAFRGLVVKLLGDILMSFLYNLQDDDEHASDYDKDSPKRKLTLSERWWWMFNKGYANGHLSWMMIDITPIARMFGFSNKEASYYFSPFGHFLDPTHLVPDLDKIFLGDEKSNIFTDIIQKPIDFIYHKGSIFMKFAWNLASGTNYAGKPYNTLAEVAGMTGETYKNGPEKGQMKRKWKFASPSDESEYDRRFNPFTRLAQFPVIFMDSVYSLIPISFQSAVRSALNKSPITTLATDTLNGTAGVGLQTIVDTQNRRGFHSKTSINALSLLSRTMDHLRNFFPGLMHPNRIIHVRNRYNIEAESTYHFLKNSCMIGEVDDNGEVLYVRSKIEPGNNMRPENAWHRYDYKTGQLYQPQTNYLRNVADYDRGHMISNANMSSDFEKQFDTFNMYNQTPQNAKLNRGVWKYGEHFINALSKNIDTLEQVVMPVYSPMSPFVPGTKSRIPDAFVKIIFATDEHGKTHHATFYLENTSPTKGRSFLDYEISDSELSAVVGATMVFDLNEDDTTFTPRDNSDLDYFLKKGGKNSIITPGNISDDDTH